MPDENHAIYKVLFVGAVCGEYSKLFEKIAAIDRSHGPFAFCLTTGPFFPTNPQNSKDYDRLARGELEAPIPIFILGAQYSDQMSYYGTVDKNDGGELFHNIIFLGRVGILKHNKTGLTIAYISSSASAMETPWPVQNKEFVDLKKIYDTVAVHRKGVDFFLSPVWPSGITTYVPDPINKEYLVKNSPLVAHLSKLLKPRYHLAFCSNMRHGCYFERLPYRNHIQDAPLSHVTRFVSLASLDDAENKKWLYGIQITPLSKMPSAELNDQPEFTTENPFATLPTNDAQHLKHKKGPVNKTKFNPHLKLVNDNNKSVGKKTKQTSREDCWFCLDNPKCEKHLILYVGEHNYLVLAKGGLVPHHLMIVSTEHHESVVKSSPEGCAEMDMFKGMLTSMFASMNQSVIFYERNYCTRHLQVQVVPVQKMPDEKIVSTFVSYGKKSGIPFRISPKQEKVCTHTFLSGVLEGDEDRKYMYIETGEGIKMVHLIDSKFPLFFAREVLCSGELLSLPSYRVDWKKCILSQSDEEAVISVLKTKINSII